MDRAVAQFGSALAWGARGRKFESCRPDHALPNPKQRTRVKELFVASHKTPYNILIKLRLMKTIPRETAPNIKAYVDVSGIATDISS